MHVCLYIFSVYCVLPIFVVVAQLLSSEIKCQDCYIALMHSYVFVYCSVLCAANPGRRGTVGVVGDHKGGRAQKEAIPDF